MFQVKRSDTKMQRSTGIICRSITFLSFSEIKLPLYSLSHFFQIIDKAYHLEKFLTKNLKIFKKSKN
jgi:hypothetical protein